MRIKFFKALIPCKRLFYCFCIGTNPFFIINMKRFTHIAFLEKTIGKLPETISCRYNPGGVFKISTDIMDNPGEAKYGFTTEQLFEGFRVLKAKGVKNFGIHLPLLLNVHMVPS